MNVERVIYYDWLADPLPDDLTHLQCTQSLYNISPYRALQLLV